jgi:hypothetical protein
LYADGVSLKSQTLGVHGAALDALQKEAGEKVQSRRRASALSTGQNARKLTPSSEWKYLLTDIKPDSSTGSHTSS